MATFYLMLYKYVIIAPLNIKTKPENTNSGKLKKVFHTNTIFKTILGFFHCKISKILNQDQ